jgi:hypothetical protein
VIVVHLKNGTKAEVPGGKTAEWEAVNTPHGTPAMLVCKSGGKILAQFLADDVAGWTIDERHE